jgi:hypothetical protein
MITISMIRVRHHILINLAILSVMVLVVIITYIAIHGDVVSYTGGQEYTNLKHLAVYNDNKVLSGVKYNVTLTSGNTYQAYNSIDGSEYKIVFNAKIIKDTKLGFKLYTTGNLMVLETSTVDTSKMSASEKKHYQSSKK